ncbi:MAG: hypothetical protein VBE63_23245 [Lamprobacter sp.]|uniref:hypothetical protein n=1 Tax=Lamprobacter sp. TaxID=3100796 RepID=UPI002B262240|nr:hypothetical protein [Lamprobacter sp.]MEA3642832.1 hypothetical protein [Lamprobacter sp.]
MGAAGLALIGVEHGGDGFAQDIGTSARTPRREAKAPAWEAAALSSARAELRTASGCVPKRA